MKSKLLFMLAMLPVFGWGEGVVTFNPSATYVDSDGVEQSIETSITHEAPFTVSFHANPEETAAVSCEWHFRMADEETDFITRYEQDVEYTFVQAGSTLVTLRAYQDNELVYETTFTIVISTSKLRMPNAFSPNGDGKNDIYKPLTYESLVEFHAYIFNRWGQKLYEWTDPSQGWDGTHHGNPVKEGVYFCLVKAKGADGVRYEIKKDVNLLRGYTDSYTE